MKKANLKKTKAAEPVGSDRLLDWLDLPKELQLTDPEPAKKARRKTTEEKVEEGLRAEREANEAEEVAP